MKKQYQAPQLQTHGTMESLTQAAGSGNSADSVQFSGFGFPINGGNPIVGVGSRNLTCSPTGCQ